jgi:hypothetical protein
MKTVFTVLVLMMTSSFAFAGDLDGMEFCREIKTDGSFGQPAGVRSHCVSFDKDIMTDYANTFFGNPPEHIPYEVFDGEVLSKGNATGYKVRGDELLMGPNEVVLKKKAAPVAITKGDVLMIANALLRNPEATVKIDKENLSIVDYTVSDVKSGVKKYTFRLARTCFCMPKDGGLTIIEDITPTFADGPIKYTVQLVIDGKSVEIK